MANICDNYLICEGIKNNLEKLLTYLVETDEDSLTLDWIRLEKESGTDFFDHRFNFYTPELEGDKLVIIFESAWTHQLNLFAFLSKKYSLTINYKYSETGVGLLGSAVITNGDVEDYPIEYGTLEYWKEYYTNHTDLEDDLDILTEEEYLASYPKEVREALDLDKAFYQ